MPANRAILADIHEKGLSHSEVHRAISTDGSLRGRQDASRLEQVIAPTAPVIVAEEKKVEQAPVDVAPADADDTADEQQAKKAKKAKASVAAAKKSKADDVADASAQ